MLENANMTLVWQYGSNMDQTRLNSPRRLKGKARYFGLGIKHGYTLTFPRSNRENVGSVSIVEGKDDDYVVGVLYEIPDDYMDCLDAIEGCNSGSHWRCNDFEVEILRCEKEIKSSASLRTATYIANEEQGDHPTNSTYANHILRGILDHGMPLNYFKGVRAIILKNNRGLMNELIPSECPFCRFRTKFTTTHFDNGNDPSCETWIDFEYDRNGELLWYAILNGNQYARGHSMVVLGNHRKRITDESLTSEEAGAVIGGVTRVAKRLKKAPNVSAVHVLSLCEGVDHLHFHLIPRGNYSLGDRMAFYRMFWDGEVGSAEQFTKQRLKRSRKFKDEVFKNCIHGMWYAGWRESQYKNTSFWNQKETSRTKDLEDLAKQLRSPGLRTPFR